jgi:hypothetical protein
MASDDAQIGQVSGNCYDPATCARFPSRMENGLDGGPKNTTYLVLPLVVIGSLIANPSMMTEDNQRQQEIVVKLLRGDQTWIFYRS